MNWLFIWILVATSLVSQAQPVSISGRTTGKYKSATQFNLYKYKSIFDQELIKSVDVREEEFFFTTTVNEYDLYMLENPIDNRFFIFVWDGQLEIQIDSVEFDQSKIINSPLTNQYEDFQRTRANLFLAPIWRLDSLKKDWQVGARYSSAQIDSLHASYNQLFDRNKVAFKQYTNKYIAQNSTSLISLFLLTLIDQAATEEENKVLFNGLSPHLKRHSRAKIYLENR